MSKDGFKLHILYEKSKSSYVWLFGDDDQPCNDCLSLASFFIFLTRDMIPNLIHQLNFH